MPASPDLEALAAMLDKMASLPRYDLTLRYVGDGDYFADMSEDPAGDWLHRGPEIVALVNAAPTLVARCRELEAVVEAAKAWAKAWQAAECHSKQTDDEGAASDALFLALQRLAHPGPAAGEPKP